MFMTCFKKYRLGVRTVILKLFLFNFTRFSLRSLRLLFFSDPSQCTSNGFIFEQQIVLPPKRTAMCIFPEGGIDAVDYVKAEDNKEVKI